MAASAEAPAYPFAVGERVEHIGSPGTFGTVRGVEPHAYGDPAYYADVLVEWECGALAGATTRHGLRSLVAAPVEGVSIETPGGVFASPMAASAAGYPVACQAFARCEREASRVLAHPVLTAVLACERCAERLS